MSMQGLSPVLLVLYQLLAVVFGGGVSPDCAGEGAKYSVISCPPGFTSIGDVTNTHKWVATANTCITMQTALCQCGEVAADGCPKAGCSEPYWPMDRPLTTQGGKKMAYTAKSKMWAHDKNLAGAANQKAVADEFKAALDVLTSARADAFACSEVEKGSAGSSQASSVDKGGNCKSPWLSTSGIPGITNVELEGTQWFTDCSNNNELIQQWFPASALMMAKNRNVKYSLTDAGTLKDCIEDELTGALPSMEIVTEVYPNPASLHGLSVPYGLVVRVGVKAVEKQASSASRKVLGGDPADLASNLNGKLGSYYTCDYYSVVVVTTPEDPSNLACHTDENGRGKTCEPLITSAVMPWTCSKEDLQACPNGLEYTYHRPDNNEATCRKVDVAVRRGVNTFRFGVAEETITSRLE